jgi:hypothetical protein
VENALRAVQTKKWLLLSPLPFAVKKLEWHFSKQLNGNLFLFYVSLNVPLTLSMSNVPKTFSSRKQLFIRGFQKAKEKPPERKRERWFGVKSWLCVWTSSTSSCSHFCFSLFHMNVYERERVCLTISFKRTYLWTWAHTTRRMVCDLSDLFSFTFFYFFEIWIHNSQAPFSRDSKFSIFFFFFQDFFLLA